jgi:hypothetical protein
MGRWVPEAEPTHAVRGEDTERSGVPQPVGEAEGCLPWWAGDRGHQRRLTATLAGANLNTPNQSATLSP